MLYKNPGMKRIDGAMKKKFWGEERGTSFSASEGDTFISSDCAQFL